jgi:hypothetical protein
MQTPAEWTVYGLKGFDGWSAERRGTERSRRLNAETLSSQREEKPGEREGERWLATQT